MIDTPADARAGRSDLDWLVDELVAVGDGAVQAVVLFGSQLSQASPSAYSAWDFVVIVRDYPTFHEALVRAGHHIRTPAMLNRLARILPPSITAFSPSPDGLPVAKCAIVTLAAFDRAMGSDSPDHFLKGRMIQKVRVEWAESEELRDRIRSTLASARERVFDWAGPWLTEPITAESLPTEALVVSYGGEVRPEKADRVLEVAASQREWLTDAYRTVLERAVQTGRVKRVEGGYAFVDPPTPEDERRVRRYFRRSKRRAIIRWAKHMLTFNDWLTYIQRKAERRTGLELEVTPAERRWPLLLLWPKVFRVLRARNRTLPGESPSGESSSESSPDPHSPPSESGTRA